MKPKASNAFRNWRFRMGLSRKEAADALGICVSAVGLYVAGTRRTRKEDKATDVEVPLSILLACAAIENDIPPIK